MCKEMPSRRQRFFFGVYLETKICLMLGSMNCLARRAGVCEPSRYSRRNVCRIVLLAVGSFLCNTDSVNAMLVFRSVRLSAVPPINGAAPSEFLRRLGRAESYRSWSIASRSLGCKVFSPTTNRPSHSLHNSRKFALFGSRAGIGGNPPGKIQIFNEQDSMSNIDEEALRKTIRRISELIGYETYDVSLLLVEDDEMQETNLESRNVDAPTDILSFPFLSHEEPGVLSDPPFDYPDYYNLGDMMVDVPYVMRRCEEDRQYCEGDDSGGDDTRELGEEDEEEERGVSGAMATVYDPEKRIHMLMVHGMLHLVGYDHEDDEDYELMVAKEEEILKELGFMP